MSDPDDIDEVFHGLGALGESEPEPIDIDDSAFPDVPQAEADDGTGPEDELIIGDDSVTYLVFADREGIDDFWVSAGDGFIEVRTDDFAVKKVLGLLVDAEEPLMSYSNGVLSVRLKRVGRRDAVG